MKRRTFQTPASAGCFMSPRMAEILIKCRHRPHHSCRKSCAFCNCFLHEGEWLTPEGAACPPTIAAAVVTPGKGSSLGNCPLNSIPAFAPFSVSQETGGCKLHGLHSFALLNILTILKVPFLANCQFFLYIFCRLNPPDYYYIVIV